MSFLLKLATGTLPSGFSFHCPGTWESSKYFLSFVSFPNFLCHVPPPLFESRLCQICTPLRIPCITGEVQLCCSCVCWRGSRASWGCAFSCWAMLLTSIPSVWQVHGILSHSLQCQHRLHVWEECQLLWYRGGTKTWCSPAASSQNHYCSDQPCWPSLFVVSGNFPALCWGRGPHRYFRGVR